MKPTLHKLKEEFIQRYKDCEDPRNKCIPMTPEMVTDWWLSKIEEIQKKQVEEIEKLPQSRVWRTPDGELSEDWYLKKDDVLSILNNKSL